MKEKLELDRVGWYRQHCWLTKNSVAVVKTTAYKSQLWCIETNFLLILTFLFICAYNSNVVCQEWSVVLDERK